MYQWGEGACREEEQADSALSTSPKHRESQKDAETNSEKFPLAK